MMNPQGLLYKIGIISLFFIVLSGVVPTISDFLNHSIAYAAPAQANQEGNTDILENIEKLYHEKASSWANALQDFAKRLFRYFLIADIILFAVKEGLEIGCGGKTAANAFGDLVFHLVLPASFMFAVITYYPEWSIQTIKGLRSIADYVQPVGDLGAGSFFTAGIALFDAILAKFKVTDPATWPLILAGLIILVLYALMAMQILLIKCESYIVLNAGIIILSLGAFAQTRSYATNFITYVLSVAVKLYVMQLIIGIAFSFVKDFVDTPPNMNNSLVVLGASIVMLGLIRVIPDMCAGIIQGQHVGSGNALAGAGAAVVGGIAGAVGGAVSGALSAAGFTASSAKSMSELGKAADAAGATGGSGRAGFMARELGKAALGAVQEGQRGSYLGRLNSAISSQAQSSRQDGGEKNQ